MSQNKGVDSPLLTKLNDAHGDSDSMASESEKSAGKYKATVEFFATLPKEEA